MTHSSPDSATTAALVRIRSVIMDADDTTDFTGADPAEDIKLLIAEYDRVVALAPAQPAPTLRHHANETLEEQEYLHAQSSPAPGASPFRGGEREPVVKSASGAGEAIFAECAEIALEHAEEMKCLPGETFRAGYAVACRDISEMIKFRASNRRVMDALAPAAPQAALEPQDWHAGYREGFRDAQKISETFLPAPNLTDPVVVHMNMLRGAIAKPSWENIKHLYPEQFIPPQTAPEHRALELVEEAPAAALRAMVIEECAKIAENYDHKDGWSADSDLNAQGYYAAGKTCDEIAEAIRALSRPDREGK